MSSVGKVLMQVKSSLKPLLKILNSVRTIIAILGNILQLSIFGIDGIINVGLQKRSAVSANRIEA